MKSPLQKPKETIIPIDVENSDATNSNEENNKDLNEGASLTNIKKTGSINPFVSAFQSIKNVFGLKSDVPDTDKPETCEKINSPKLRSDSENNDNHINFSKKSDLLVTDKKITIDLSSDEDSEKIFHSSKKRPSPPDTDRFNCIKRLKMDRTSNQVNKTSKTPLKTEIEIAKKQQSVPFKRRNIEAILNELGMVHKMYKEASVKYRFPVRWGTPIVKNCERWDSQNIPKKLIDRYHKYLTNNDLGPPAFVPPTHEFETSAVVEPLRNYQAIEDDDDEDLFRTNTRSRSKDELNTDFERKTELKVILDNVEQENVKNTPKQGSSRKTRAGRSQQKKIDVDYDPGAGDENDKGIESHQDQDSEEWLPKNERRPKKNGKASKQGKNLKINLKRQPVVKLEKIDTQYKFFTSKNADVPEKGSKSKKDDVIHLSQVRLICSKICLY